MTGYFGNKIVSNSEADPYLVISGVYVYSRYSMYLGSVITEACLLSSVFNLFVLPFYLVTIHKHFIDPEEAVLMIIFDESFVEYKQKLDVGFRCFNQSH